MRAKRSGCDALVVFVHVPKTGGSTVNHLLAGSGIPGLSHIENRIGVSDRAGGWAGGLAGRVIKQAGWISGHVSLPRMQALAATLTLRPARFFTLIRNPTAQIASHYNWLIEIHQRGPGFYNGHPRRIREISAAIRNSDNSDPRVIIANLQRHAGLFLNLQSRIVIGEDAPALAQADQDKRLAAYTQIAAEGRIAELVGAMTGQAPARITRMNRSPYHFDPAVFHSLALQEFLASENARDQALHALVSAGNRMT